MLRWRFVLSLICCLAATKATPGQSTRVPRAPATTATAEGTPRETTTDRSAPITTPLRERPTQPESMLRSLRQPAAARTSEAGGVHSSVTTGALDELLRSLQATAPYDASASGRYLVATHPNRGLVLFDAAARRAIRALDKSQHTYALVKISADARWIAAVRADSPDLIDLWRADNGRWIRTITADNGAKRSLEFSSAGDQLRVELASGGGTIYSIPAGSPTGRFQSASGGAAPQLPTDQFTVRSLTPATSPTAAGSAASTQPPISSAPAPAAPTQEPAAKVPAMEAWGGPEPPIAEPMMAAPMAAPPVAAPLAATPPLAEPQASSTPTEQSVPRSGMQSTSIAPSEPITAEPQAAAAPLASTIESLSPGDSHVAAAPHSAQLSEEAAGSDATADSQPAAQRMMTADTAPGAAPPVEDLSKVSVHYATNRNRLAIADRTWQVYFRGFFFSLPAVIVYALMVVALLVLPWFGKRSWAAAALLSGVLVLISMAALEAYVRSQLRDELSGELYGSVPGDLKYGVCDISVPKPENRTAGEVNRPLSVWVFEAPENPDKHFVLRQVHEHADKDEFYRSLSTQVERSADGASLLFIHGYNVSFEDALFRTAQLAVDLQYRGAPILFSWPSYADPVKYTFDEQNAEVSIPALREFLEDLAARSGAQRIHIIAHSMGNRVLAGALRSMPPEVRPRNKAMFREIVLAAPDIDSRVFKSQVLPHLEENTQHCTLYASSRDRALMMSRYFHNYQRLGETEPQLIVASGMDTIDASLVDTSLLGHSYIGDVQSIVTDLHDLVVIGKRPTERGGLQSSLLGELIYWAIKPQLQTAADADTRR